jgi:GH35 family endo-1,4-beta-xylanase
LSERYRLPSGAALFGETETEVLGRFHLHGPAADAATLRVIAVPGKQPFTKAIRIDVKRLSGEFWHTMLQGISAHPVKKGDVLLVTLWARGGVPSVAGSPGLTNVGIKPIPGPPQGFATRELVLSDRWQRVMIPIEVTEDREADKLEWVSTLGSKMQWLEFGGISVINFGPNVKVAALPDTSRTRLSYAGREPDAAWRRDAAARIEKIRKGNLTVRVVDGRGKPVPAADVKAEMTRHAFRWGTSLVPSIEIEPVPDWNRHGHETQFRHLFDLFNHVAVDIDLKFDRWYGADEKTKARALEGLRTLRERGMTVHGHTMIWPGFANMPQAAKFKDDPARLRAELLGHIREIGRKTGPYCHTWDVLNEPYGNQEIVRILGDDCIAEWFRTARQSVPAGVKLYINEGITPGAGTATEAYYYDLCRRLVKEKAPLDGIGLQCHVGGGAVNIADVWASLEKFATLKPGLELSVSEFDINFPTDRNLEGDFTRDLVTLAFSHPAMTGFTMWGFHDPYHWLGYAPLFDKDGVLKPSGKAWMSLVCGAWVTRKSGKADAKGAYRLRGFLGDYRITVSRNGRTRTVPAKLVHGGTEIRVVL